MQSGGTRQTILVATALAASAVLAAWWWSAQQSGAIATAANIANTGGARGGVGATARQLKSAPAFVPVANSAGDKPLSSPDSSGASNAQGLDAKSPSPVSRETSSREDDPTESQPTGAEPVADEASPSAENSQTETPPGDGAGIDVMPGSAVDTERVTEMYARLFEKIASEDDSIYTNQKLEFQGFDGKEPGGESERDLEQALRERFGEWIATLPPELAMHVLLAAVDCHVGECRVLLAQNGVDFVDPGVRNPQNPLNLMRSAIGTFLADGLPDRRRWNVILNGQYAAGGGSEGPLDMALWVVLLGVQASEAASIEP